MKIITPSQFNTFSEFTNLDIPIVKTILKDVQKNKDSAVKKYTKRFDKLNLKNLEISKQEIKQAYKQVDKKTIAALKIAAKNITFFAKKQLANTKEFELKNKGITLGQKIIPIENLGCYVPGGRYPLPSSALMSIIPAKVAGVKNIVVCSPKIAPVTIVAADLSGANQIFNVGGAQAIASLAFGTETIPKVDKIVGPGNKFVAAAKKEIFGIVGIDFIAGPSELLIIADDSANPEYIAADLLAQAEHDPDAIVNVLTCSKLLGTQINTQLKKQLQCLSTKEVAKQSLKKGSIIIVKSIDETISLSNKIAPEHLELMIKNPNKIIPKLKNYGSLFIGDDSAEVFGDYCSGTNHILPTNYASKYTGSLSPLDFVKIVTFQKINKKNKKAVKNLIKVSSTLAEVEGLDAHKKAAEIRELS